MIFYFLFKEDYIANMTSGWKAKNFPSFYYLPNTNEFIVVNACQTTPFPATQQANEVWQVGSCLPSFLIRRLSDMLPAHCLLHRVAALVFGQQGLELELPR